MTVHKPVLLEEAMRYLDPKKGDTVVDATLGGGGYAKEIIKHIFPGGKLVVIDWDEEAIEEFKRSLQNARVEFRTEDIVFAHGNFAGISAILAAHHIKNVAKIVADLGLSSDQLKNARRGFSFQEDGPLDMRYDRKDALRHSAYEILNDYSQQELARIIRNYGQERYAARIARAIVAQRQKDKIERTGQLVDVIRSAVPDRYSRSRIHFATRTFQALRIEVNRELENLKIFLEDAFKRLANQGKLAVVTFHSLEDRIVKHTFREWTRGCICPAVLPVCQCGLSPLAKVLTPRPIRPQEEEVRKNPRARSAILRVAQKLK